MRPVQRLIALAIVCLSAGVAVRAEGEERASALPTPPQQNEPWTPPETRLPKFLVTASRLLFEQGLADPRGCEYRSIRIQVDDLRGGRLETVTTGWALPADDGGEPRHAVAWNGLVYPLIAVGEPADLDADVRAIGIDQEPAFVNHMRFNPFPNENEAASVALEPLKPIQACLALRLGRTDLAEALWTAAGHPLAPQPTGPGPNLDLRSYGVSYLTLATDFASLRYGRAVRAHLRGDDVLALADARALDAFWRAVDAKAAEMGFVLEIQPFTPPAPRREGVSRYLPFLDQAPALLADQERRARERANPPPTAPEGDEIATLIRALDQAAAPPPGAFLNGAAFAGLVEDSPTIKALVALGDDAVEPLIQALRSDERLTRSLALGGRALVGQRAIMRADQAAYIALTKILKVSTFSPPSLMDNDGQPVDRDALADQIQEYWDKNKSIPLVERWYRTLADDQAGAVAWLDAVGNIVRPENVVGQAIPGARPRLQGEPLREGHSPSVTELLIRRIDSIGKTANPPDPALNQTMIMAGHLTAWDPAAAAPVLRDLTRDRRERFAQAKTGGPAPGQAHAAAIAQLTTQRVRIGDDSALDEYVEWIKTTSLDSIQPVIQALLEPIRSHPDDPNLSAAADWLLNDPQSPWAALTSEKGATAARRLGQLVTSPAIEIPAFRKLVQTAMADQTVVGEAEIRDDGLVSVKFDDGAGMGGMSARDRTDPDAPPIGAKTAVRARDFLAWRLAIRGDAPHFNPCWPEPKRDAAFAEIIEFLKRGRPR